MKKGYHAIFFLQRLNPIPRGFKQNIQFPRNFRRFTQKSAETFGLEKLSPNKLDEKGGI